MASYPNHVRRLHGSISLHKNLFGSIYIRLIFLNHPSSQRSRQLVTLRFVFNHTLHTTMFLSAKRTFNLLLHTPIVPPTPGPQAIELATIPSTSAAFSTAAPPRLRARTISNLSVRGYDPSSPYYRSVGVQKRGYAERKTDEEAYPEEAEGTEAGVSVSSRVKELHVLSAPFIV